MTVKKGEIKVKIPTFQGRKVGILEENFLFEK